MNYPYQPMANNYPVYKPTQAWAPATIPQVRPVSSLEEVKACPIEFDGSVFYFTDVANKRIYTKYINMDGTVAINLYELKELTADQPSDLSYVTRTEFESAISQLKAMLETSPRKEPQKPTAQQTNYENYQF